MDPESFGKIVIRYLIIMIIAFVVIFLAFIVTFAFI
jgi:hypothetical protein